jgi:hypothetical protein
MSFWRGYIMEAELLWWLRLHFYMYIWLVSHSITFIHRFLLFWQLPRLDRSLLAVMRITTH